MQACHSSEFSTASSGPFDQSRHFGRTAGRRRPSGHQRLPFQIQVGQPDQREHLGGILRDSPITRLDVAKLALHHSEDRLHSATDRRQLTAPPFLSARKLALRTRFQRHAPKHASGSASSTSSSPANRRIDSISYKASSMPGSDRAYHCCRR